MNSGFDATSTTKDVLHGVDLSGKCFLVTGVSAGLGIETARALVAHGASVLGTARDIQKAEQATGSIREAAEATNGSFELIQLDLADLASVRTCTGQLRHQGREIDVVIANAGVMGTPSGRTKDGFETQFGTNYLGHFVFINRIIPLLRDSGRIVILSSAAHGLSDIDLDDLNFDATPYDPWIAYARSKTAGILFAVELDRRHRERGIRATAVHPGTIRTELQRHYNAEQEAAYIALTRKGNTSSPAPVQWKTVQQGAATSIWASVIASGDLVGGQYCLNSNVALIVDSGDIRAGVRSYALDTAHAQALWAKSEELVGEQFKARSIH
ncbi:SDR family NAD(P)-dependent oxidoreductase [Pantoea coffeiphila]|uniref:Probable oxidoreductase n=1 Tax=Pantoea coffeiphila TaxID=1465635 RepID=A0A2S9I765_9GAMM|nr:SDR family NAD(P)-dependent oxidoreductase [Pantoea coffeiphila]PRD13625.1 shikimate dehydrogenase [Pantoea coffeiphila]